MPSEGDEYHGPDRESSYSGPFCDRAFSNDVAPGTPANEIGREYREHVRDKHPVQDHDLKTTRWHDGLFVRCEPLPERARPCQVGRRRTPPAGHGLKLLIHLDQRESDDGPMGVFCTCGFKDVAPHGRSMAMAMLEWHWARTHRLQCPFCDWSRESDLRDSIERHMAVHIGVTHPERFPWGYESATEPASRAVGVAIEPGLSTR